MKPLLLPKLLRPLFWGLAAATLAGTAQAQAQATRPAPTAATQGPAAGQRAPLQVQGQTLDGKPFNLTSLKGKVVLLMYWSTDCAVCLDKMPELRRNVEGWAGQPFELVMVSADKRKQDIESYEALIARTVPMKQRFAQLWSGQTGYLDNIGRPAQLPTSYLMDKQGKVVKTYAGRIPAQAWDDISDLL